LRAPSDTINGSIFALIPRHRKIHGHQPLVDEKEIMLLRRFMTALWALAAMVACAGTTLADPTLEGIKSAGVISCGVPSRLAGFAVRDSQGRWAGFDVDICKALSAAIFGAVDKVKFVPFTAQQRFAALQSG
jgi:general L-amino acid transport system substrate-binding protein